MGDVKRYAADEQYPGQYSARCDLVAAYDFDAALAREAALREELAEEKQRSAQYGRSFNDQCRKTDDLQQRLTAAEQRNSELVELLNTSPKDPTAAALEHLERFKEVARSGDVAGAILMASELIGIAYFQGEPGALNGEVVAYLDLEKLQRGMAYATRMRVNHRQTPLRAALKPTESGASE